MEKEIKVIRANTIEKLKPSVSTALIIVLNSIDISHDLQPQKDVLICTDDVFCGDQSSDWNKFGFVADIIADDIDYNVADIQQTSSEDFDFYYHDRFRKEHAKRIHQYFNSIDNLPMIKTIYVAYVSGSSRAAAIAKSYQMTHGMPLIGDYRRANTAVMNLLDDPCYFDEAFVSKKFDEHHPIIANIKSLWHNIIKPIKPTKPLTLSHY